MQLHAPHAARVGKVPASGPGPARSAPGSTSSAPHRATMIAPPSLPLRRAAASAARPRSSAALARSLAAAALAASATGCLVISPPEYDEPSQTGPVLTAVFPPQHIPIHIVGPRVVTDLGVTVLSEDNGEPVLVTLYIDYGRRSLREEPYGLHTTPRELEARTIADG